MRRPTVLYDYQVFFHQDYGGVSRYFAGLMNNMKRLGFVLAIIFSENKYLNQSKILKYPPLPLGRLTFSGYINKLCLFWHFIKSNYDIFHPTEPDKCFFLQRKPMVITVHDMIFELMPDQFPNVKVNYIDKVIRNKKKQLEKADHIIAISHNTKNDILKLYPHIPEDKITVVYHACVMETVTIKTDVVPMIKGKYILYVGGRNGYKNFQWMLKAIAPLFKKYGDIKLVCTGAPFSEEENELITYLEIQDHILNISASDDMMSDLYSNAMLLLYPSLYEGFGYPILEAFHYETPICLSNASCFPEIAQDAAIYFNPYDEDDIKNALETLINDSNLRQDLVEKGKERLLFFSMDKMIKTTENIYLSVLVNGKN